MKLTIIVFLIAWFAFASWLEYRTYGDFRVEWHWWIEGGPLALLVILVVICCVAAWFRKRARRRSRRRDG